MSHYDKNHYVQCRLLKNFAQQNKNGNNVICVLNLINFAAYYAKPENAFCENNLYDVEFADNNKDLELKFKTNIEDPMGTLLNKIDNDSAPTFTFTRAELETIKKYILLQIYRTPHNKKSYTNILDNTFELSQFNINQNESKVDFWKREMLTILDSDWDSLLKTDMIGICKNALEINSSFLMFIKTADEFCINDLGYCTERIPIKIPKDQQDDFIKTAQIIGQELYGKDNFDEIAKKEIADESSYIDNYILFPISSNIAILVVSPLWKQYLLHPELRHKGIPFHSLLLQNHLSIPMTTYKNADKIKNDADIVTYKSPEDQYIYQLHTMSCEETVYMNHLTINEAFCYIGLKTPDKFLKTIREYNSLASMQTRNIKKSLLGYVELLSKLSKTNH